MGILFPIYESKFTIMGILFPRQAGKICYEGTPVRSSGPTPVRFAEPTGQAEDTKDIFYYFFLSVLVTWWQKEKGWPQKAHNRNLRKQLAKTIKIL